MNICNDKEFSPLMFYDYNCDIIKKMVNAGANLDRQDYNGDTVLINNIKFRNGNLALDLIDLGADVNIKNNLDNTALDLMMGICDPKVIEAFKRKVELRELDSN